MEHRATQVERAALKRLQREFEAGELADGWSDIFLSSECKVGAVGTVSGVVDASARVSVYGSIGLAAGAYSIGQGLLTKAGYLEAEYSGPQWPVLYTFGGKATGKRRTRLRGVLDRLV